MTTVQEMVMDISMDGAQTLPGPGGPLSMTMKTTTVMTQKTGPVKADGGIDAELRYEELRTDVSMNGQPMPTSDAVSQFVGKVVQMIYNRDGQIVDTRFPPDFPATADMVKQIITTVSGSLPVTPMGIGEVVTLPLVLSLPIPLPGASPMNMSGENRLKLVSIDRDANGRSARFESTAEGKMVADVPSPDGKTGASMSFTITGGGTTVMDLDAGFLRSAVSKTTFDGTLTTTPAAGPALMPAMKMHGTMTVTTTGSN